VNAGAVIGIVLGAFACGTTAGAAACLFLLARLTRDHARLERERQAALDALRGALSRTEAKQDDSSEEEGP
jgi:hypothetical protein